MSKNKRNTKIDSFDEVQVTNDVDVIEDTNVVNESQEIDISSVNNDLDGVDYIEYDINEKFKDSSDNTEPTIKIVCDNKQGEFHHVRNSNKQDKGILYKDIDRTIYKIHPYIIDNILKLLKAEGIECTTDDIMNSVWNDIEYVIHKIKVKGIKLIADSKTGTVSVK